MKFFVVALSLFAVAAAAPMYSEAEIAARRRLPALEHEEKHDEYGQFALRYVTAEGTVVSERGRLVPNAEGTGYVMIIEGEYSYIGDDGQMYITKYTAGPDGYHVEGNHLPVSVTPEPLLVSAEPTEVVAEPVRVDPVPVEEVAESTKVVGETAKVVIEPVEVAAEPARVVAEPIKVIVESIGAATESVAEPGRVIVQPIEFIVEPFVAGRPH